MVVKAAWLQLSDLHVSREADTNTMLSDFKKLKEVISPQFLIATGDFRNMAMGTDFLPADRYLNSVLDTFGILKEDTFLVPGNHDASTFPGRDDYIRKICSQSEKDYNCYYKYLHREKPSLNRAFSEYNMWVKWFYQGSGVDDDRGRNPSGTYCIRWRNMLDIVGINTALISDGKEHGEIIDIDSITTCVYKEDRPKIVIGHHGIHSLFNSHLERLQGVFDRNRISAYLHGDWHKYANKPITKISTPNRTLPEICCCKSAPQSGDSYSDIGVVYYEWREDDNTYVQAYRWSTGGFIQDPTYMYNITEVYNFPMLDAVSMVTKSQKLYEQLKTNLDDSQFLDGKWVAMAEKMWKEEHYEGIGSFLLSYYTEKAMRGDCIARNRAVDMYKKLRNVRNRGEITEQVLCEVRSMLKLN